MRYILFSLLSIFIIIGFSACGGSDSNFEGSEGTSIDVVCVDSPSSSDIDTYIALSSGDSIVKSTDGTTVSIYHDENGNKKVCLVSGSAYIVSSD